MLLSKILRGAFSYTHCLLLTANYIKHPKSAKHKTQELPAR